MAAKRASSPAPAAPADAKRACTRSPSRVRAHRAPAASIHSLPVELLSEVFAYAPFYARLRAISLVCKRWRTAALRSIRSLKFCSLLLATPCFSPSVFSALLALLPSLTRLKVKGSAYAPLPATLQTLELTPAFLDAAADAEYLGLPTFFTRHIPALTSLTLCSGDPRRAEPKVSLSWFTLSRLRDFIAMHSTQLTQLGVRGGFTASYVEQLRRHRWPLLKELWVDHLELPEVRRFVADVSVSRDCLALSSTVYEEAALLALPNMSKMGLDNIVLCCPPVHFSRWGADNIYSSYTAMLKREMGGTLPDLAGAVFHQSHFGDGECAHLLQSLCIQAPFYGTLDFIEATPNVRHVQLGLPTQRFAPSEGILLASGLLRGLRRLESLTIYLQRSPGPVDNSSDSSDTSDSESEDESEAQKRLRLHAAAKEATKAMDALLLYARRRTSVRKVSVHWDSYVEKENYGWIHFSNSPPKECFKDMK